MSLLTDRPLAGSDASVLNDNFSGDMGQPVKALQCLVKELIT